MKRNVVFAILAFTLALPAIAQEDFDEGELNLGILQRDSDSLSSKFLEYRDIPQGPVAPYVSFLGKKGDLRYRIWGRDITQKDQWLFGYLRNDVIRFDASYLSIPHNFGNGGKSILSPTSENNWQVSDNLQRYYQDLIALTPGAAVTYSFLNNLVTPSLKAAPSNIDVKLLRGRTNLALTLTPKESDFSVGVGYFHERRSGSRAANGTSFGFGNVVETPEPVRYITQDFGINAAYKDDWGSVKAAVRFNDFKNAFDTFSFDNPFRYTDSTDASAYTAPGAGSKGGPVFGRMSLYPDNKATTEMVGATLKVGAKTRLTADLTLGQWKQNEDPFIPWTTNTAIKTPGGVNATTAPLPATALDGKADTMALNAFVNTRLNDSLQLNARYRRYDFDNKTPRYELDEGYVRFDAVWEEIPRITVPYGYTNDIFDVYATLGKGVLGLEAGWKYNKMARTFRETEATSENVFRIAADVRSGAVVFRGIGEFGSRDHDAYDAEFSEEQSFLCESASGLVPCGTQGAAPEVPANQTVLRRVDQAKRDLTRVGGQLELSPGSGKLSLFASYFHTKFEYKQDPVECQGIGFFPTQARYCPGGEAAPLGMVDDTYDTFSFEASLNASERANIYAFYTWEDGDILQNGRQSGATLNFNPADVWTSNITNKGNTFGTGANFTLVPEKWFFRVFARYQKVEGNNDIFLQTGYDKTIYTSPLLLGCIGAGSTACDIGDFDDTELTSVMGSLSYAFATQWTAGFGIGFEDYSIKDAQTGNTLNYMPASFFLQADNRDYSAWVGYLSLNYKW